MAAAPPVGLVVRRRQPAVTVAKWAGIGLLSILLLIGAFLVWLNSDPGRRFIVRQINAFETVSGLQVRVDRIEGSVFGALTLHGLSMSDPQGVFFRAPIAEVDYRPFAYLRNRIDVRALTIPEARLSRLPALRAGDPNAPLLPDIDIDVGRLRVGRLLVDPAITGRRHLLSLDSTIKIDDGRAQFGLNAATVIAPGFAGGDRLVLRLDAVPTENRLDVGLVVRSPADGFIAGLIGVDQPILAHVEGRGDWTRWQGRARAALGNRRFAELSLAARNGTFTARGPLRPGLLLSGPVERIAGLTQLDLSSTFAQRRADVRLRLVSRAAMVAAEGLVDLGQNRFQDLRVAARLTEPGAIAPNLSGRNVQLAFVLNGPFATPGVAYELRAASLTFGTMTVEGLRAVGSARVRSEDIIVPVSATASRILGFDAVAGGTIANVALNGELGVTGARLVSDNLRLRSDRIDATVALAFDLSAGRYLAAIQGRVNNYLVDGVGLFDVNANFEMVNRADGFGLRGRVAARSRRITNTTIADLLGGPATVFANVAVDPSGLVRVDAIRLAAPLLRVTSGSGNYQPNGSIDFRLSGVSDSYGPLVVRVTGTPNAPQIRLNAANPGLGIGLRDVEASVRATRGGWAIQAAGQSAYGPFTADVVILSGRGPMTIVVNRLTFAGIDLQGRVVRTQPVRSSAR